MTHLHRVDESVTGLRVIEFGVHNITHHSDGFNRSKLFKSFSHLFEANSDNPPILSEFGKLWNVLHYQVEPSAFEYIRLHLF